MNRRLQVAFMTGQSDPGRCALSPAQEAFLDALAVPEDGKVRTNFPYDDDTPSYRSVPIVAASWHNARQYLASRRPDFGERHRPSVLRMLARANHTVLLAGSCGLELLGNLALPESALHRVHVFAYGPVFRHRPECEIVIVRGRSDWIARVGGDGGGGGHLVDGGHMTYLRNAEVLALCRTSVARIAARAGALS